MSERERDAIVERAASLGRGAEPPPLDAATTAAWLDRAMAGAATPRATGSPWRRAVAIAAALAIAGLAGLLWWSRTEPGPAGAEPMRLELPTGDRLAAVAGTSFRVQASTPELRAIALSEGTMLFDVAPLGAAQRFEVTSGRVRVVVRGTVFSVASHDGRVRVRVYEGQVAVEAPGVHRSLRATEQWSSDEVPQEPDLLAAEATRAVARRARLAAAEPAPAPAPVSGPVTAPAPAPAPAPVPAPAPAPAPTHAPSLAAARASIAAGRGAEALTAAEAALAVAPSSAEWRIVRGDACRSLGRNAEAADDYDAAARLAPRSAAGYLAARTRLRSLGDPAGALASLDAAGADAPGAPIAERALVLRVEALDRLGRAAESQRAVRRYLAEFPEGGHAAAFRERAQPGDANQER